VVVGERDGTRPSGHRVNNLGRVASRVMGQCHLESVLLYIMHTWFGTLDRDTTAPIKLTGSDHRVKVLRVGSRVKSLDPVPSLVR